MTTELVLLLGLFVFLLFGIMTGEGSPEDIFSQSAPRLAARVERDLAVGSTFVPANKPPNQWRAGTGRK